MRGINCPNCGAPYNPARFVWDSCGSFVIMSNANQYDVPKQTIEEISRRTQQAAEDPKSSYPGTYVFGKLLGVGEVPIRMGAANYYTSALMSSGGKLLLTGRNIYFSSHMFNNGRTDLCIPLADVTEVKNDRNQIISDQISVFVGKTRYKFVVYGGWDWVSAIQKAKSDPAAFKTPAAAVDAAAQGDYTDELVKLKKLLDAGIITEEEFTIKKRMLLGI